jgi:hypothetical protein
MCIADQRWALAALRAAMFVIAAPAAKHRA